MRTERDIALISAFVGAYFSGAATQQPLTEEETSVIRSIVAYVDQRFARQKYILGLALDFTILAQRLSLSDAELNTFRPGWIIQTLFERYTLVRERGGVTANTLTLQYVNSHFGIRQTEEEIVVLFQNLSRSGYPSAYVYNTGQWQKYEELLLLCFQLSVSGRYKVCNQLIDYGLTHLTENRFFGREVVRPRLFPRIVSEYDCTSRKTENAGLILQSIVFGFVTADRPHLDLIADKVRTGSARQRRFGDIEGYFGLDLELSVEVKDLAINSQNRYRELDGFIAKVKGSGINGIAFAKSFDTESERYLRDAGVIPFTPEEMLAIVVLWDWQKQDRAVQGMLHYLSHIEQNANAVNRLLEFIASEDKTHTALVYLAKNPVPESGFPAHSDSVDEEPPHTPA